MKNHDEVKALLDEILITRPRSVWLDKLNAAGVPCGSINTLDQVLTHPQVLARDMVVEVDHPVAGKTKLTGAPVKLSDTPAEIRTPPPLLGEHTDEVLTEVLGLSASEIEALRAGGVV